MKICRSRYANM